MATLKKKQKALKYKFSFPLQQINYLILAGGVFVLILGYIFMAMADHPDDFISRTLAPILLTFSFFVIIPLGILYKSPSNQSSRKTN